MVTASLFVLSLVSCLFWTIEGQSIRLVTKREQTSSSLTAGRLEVYYRGQWGTVCDDGFGTSEATVACRQLGFSSYLDYGTVDSSKFGFDAASNSTPIWLDNLYCSSYDSHLSQCSSSGVGYHDCTHREDVALSCLGNGALKLGSYYSSFTSSGRQSGRVEVYYNGEWGTVCDDSFDQTDADVACRQLGYDSATNYGSVGTLGFSQGSGKTWLDNLQCTSYDLMLSTCLHNGFGDENCGHSEDVAVSCTSIDKSLPIRLVTKGEHTSSTLTAGRLEVYYNGQWGTVCGDSFYYTEATVACYQLGFSSYLDSGTVGSSYGDYRFDAASSSTPIWLSSLSCYSSSYSSLSQCSHSGFGVNSCTHSQDVTLFCEGEGALRLNSYYLSYVSSGRLEIYHNGEWGTVCDNYFDQTDADVACRQLGYDSTSNYGTVGALGFSEGYDETIWLSELQCTSSDLMLSTCSHSGFGNTYCSHSQDVAVSCTRSTDAGPTRSTSTSTCCTSRLSFGTIFGVVVAVVIVFVGVIAGIIACAIRSGRQRSIRRGTTAANSNYPATILTHSSTRSSSNVAYSVIPQEPPPPYPGSPTTYTPGDGQPQPQVQQFVSHEYPQAYPQQTPYGTPYYPPVAESAPSTSQLNSESDNLLPSQDHHEAQPSEPTAPPQTVAPQDQQLPYLPHSDPAYPPTAGVVAPYPTTTTAVGGRDTNP